MAADKPRPSSQARVVVGLDFGTTFSGFAVALAADPNDPNAAAAAAPGAIHTFYEWPMQERAGGKPYCKTQTSLLYAPQPRRQASAAPPSKPAQTDDPPAALGKKKPLALPRPGGLLKRIQGPTKVSPGGQQSGYATTHWGWPAQVAYLDSLQARRQAVPPAGADEEEEEEEDAGAEWFVSGRIKLLLAGSDLLQDVPEFDPTRICDPPERSLTSLLPPPSALDAKTSARRRRGFWSCRKLVTRVAPAWLQQRLLLSTKSGDSSKVPKDERAQDEHEKDDDAADTSPPLLPPGITVDRAISDYLAKLAHLALTHVQAKYGSHITMREVQWCLTVPAIWDNAAKQKMARCAEQAGMVTGARCPTHLAGSASPHPLAIVLESEAAALFCVQKAAAAGASLDLRKGDQFVVADVGGGTVDIAVHSLEDDEGAQVREVAMSSGGLCGGTFVDSNFVAYLARRVPCFREYVARNPAGMRVVMRRWEEVKCGFDGSPTWGSRVFELPARLAAAWKSFDHHGDGDKKRDSYNEIEITGADMAAIFDPVVDKVVHLIKAQVTAARRARALMLVGGFSASPYLVKRVREEIGAQGLVQTVIVPPNPGSAICQGAVMLGLRPDTVVTRIARKTYGVQTVRSFRGLTYRRRVFTVHVRRGDAVTGNQRFALKYRPVIKSQSCVQFSVYSSDRRNPKFTHEPGARFEGRLVMDISDDPHNLGRNRKVKHTMDFRGSCIHFYSQRENFGDTTEVVRLNHTVRFDASHKTM